MKSQSALALPLEDTALDPMDTGEVPLPRILLLDDDALFCRLMAKIAAKRNIPVITCQKVDQFRELARWAPYDVVILDYYLEGNLTAPEIARDLRHQSVIVISNNERELDLDTRWPESVKISISKALGIGAILEAACALSYF